MAAVAAAVHMGSTPRSATPRGTTPRATTPSGSLTSRSKVKVPFLPGYGLTAPGLASTDLKTSFRKTQSLVYGPGGANPSTKGYSAGSGELPKLDLASLESLCDDPMRQINGTTRSITHDEREALRESARNTYKPAIPPAWLKHDRQVLRFAAYFQEPVHENPKENFRVRHCTIFFYLEDGTMMITEPKIENSGIPQGTFAKRHRIPKPDGDFYTYHDLQTGETIVIYSRAFRIYDCDPFTRDFYANALGVSLAALEPPPLDSFRATQIQEDDMLTQPKARDIIESKEYNELSVGGNRKNAKLQQYLENDRRVLCFKAFWDDTTHYGARMYYTLHYHLADDTVEILENLARNSGRDPYPVFWRRSPLRKNPHTSATPGMIEPEADPYKPEDFAVGSTINVYNRDIYLYDCDDFTREFYRGYMGVEQESFDIKSPDALHVQLSHPPHTGFGAEDDSLASCLRLTPRPPRRDINKLMNEAGKVMRFEGRVATGISEDSNRVFIIVISLSDDSIGVWEKRLRNSGHASGKFALKSKKRNPATGTWFQPQDFFLGGLVEINAMPFHLVAADDATIRYMEENSHDFPAANLRVVMAKLARAKDILAKASEQGKAECSLQEFHGLVQQAGVDLCLHEALTLARNYGHQDGHAASGSITIARLLAAL